MLVAWLVSAMLGITLLIRSDYCALVLLIVGTLTISHPELHGWTTNQSHWGAIAGGLCLAGLSCLGTWLLFGGRGYIMFPVLLATFGIGSTVANSTW